MATDEGGPCVNSAPKPEVRAADAGGADLADNGATVEAAAVERGGGGRLRLAGV